MGVNIVHKNSILCETIQKEERFFQLYTDYRVNPKNVQVLTGKPNTTSLYDTDGDDGVMKDLEKFQSSKKMPKDKYEGPITESMVIGWDSEPLVKRTTDPRLHHPRIQSGITKFYDRVAQKS